MNALDGSVISMGSSVSGKLSVHGLRGTLRLPSPYSLVDRSPEVMAGGRLFARGPLCNKMKRIHVGYFDWCPAVVRIVIVDGHFSVIRWLNLVGFLGDFGPC